MEYVASRLAEFEGHEFWLPKKYYSGEGGGVGSGGGRGMLAGKFDKNPLEVPESCFVDVASNDYAFHP